MTRWNFPTKGILLCLLALLFVQTELAHANIPGGGTGTGANVTITDNGTTVTMANGIVSIIITKTDASIHTISYTYNNSGATTTNQLLAGGGDTDDLYWLENAGSFLAGPFTESVVANTGTYAQISLAYASSTNGIMEVDYSMLKGSPGFYATAILTHRAQDPEIYITLRPNIYAGAQFNWMSVDANRNKLMEVSGGTTLVCPTSPVENYLWTNGIYQGHYEDKYKYTADLYSLPAWGWSSVGSAGPPGTGARHREDASGNHWFRGPAGSGRDHQLPDSRVSAQGTIGMVCRVFKPLQCISHRVRGGKVQRRIERLHDFERDDSVPHGQAAAGQPYQKTCEGPV